MAADTRPGAKVRIKLRLEDFGIDPPPPEFFNGQSGMEAFGGGGKEPVSPSEYIRVIDIQPHDFSIEINSPRKADTCKVSFPRAKFPLDPQIVRSVGIQVFAGVYTSAEYAEACGPSGAAGLWIPDVVPDGRPMAGASNELFRGFVDDYSMTLRDGGNIVEMSARDSSSLLMDAEIISNPLRGLPWDMPLDQIIKGMLEGDGLPPALTKRGGLPGARGTAVVVETSRPVPTLRDIKPPTWFGAKKTVKKPKKQKPEKAKKMSFWDFVTDLCVSAGLKAYVRAGRKPINIPGLGYVLPAAEIVICDAQTYYAGKPNPATPLFAYGRNVQELTMRHHLGGVALKTIEVRSFDRRTGKQIRGRYPPDPRVNKATPSGAGDREDITVFEISELSGPNAEEQAAAIARSYYDQLSRGEFSCQIRTKALSAVPGNEQIEGAPDMLYLRPGDPIRVITDPARDEYGQVTYEGEIAAMSQEQYTAVLMSHGYTGPVAMAIARAQYDPRRQTVFYTQSIGVGFSRQGFDFTVQATNYLDARGAIDNPNGDDQ